MTTAIPAASGFYFNILDNKIYPQINNNTVSEMLMGKKHGTFE
jgi:hypothetical protein